MYVYVWRPKVTLLCIIGKNFFLLIKNYFWKKGKTGKYQLRMFLNSFCIASIYYPFAFIIKNVK